jgi:pimeloyl-ACP methyl ester carboxylesterase
MNSVAESVALPEQLEQRFAARTVALEGDASVSVRSAGRDDAPAVVLLHGIGSGAGSWLQVALALAPSARVIAWDAPGYGASTPLASARPCATDYAARLHALLAALDVGTCTVVGHSLGALMGAAFAHGIGRPLAQRLVLISPARGYGAPGRGAAREHTRDSRLAALRAQGIAGIAERMPQRLLSDQAGPDARAWVRWNAARLDPAGYAQAVEMLCRDDIERYAGLDIPVDVHVGAADAVTPPQDGRLIAERFGASFALIADAGHASPVEQPSRVADAIACAMSLSPVKEHAP